MVLLFWQRHVQIGNNDSPFCGDKGSFMQSDYLSRFKPTLTWEPGGVKVIIASRHVVAVPAGTYPLDLSQQARVIHQWLLDKGGSVLVADVIKHHGYPMKRPYGLPDTKTLRAFPLEELYDHSLLYVVEEHHPDQEGA